MDHQLELEELQNTIDEFEVIVDEVCTSGRTDNTTEYDKVMGHWRTLMMKRLALTSIITQTKSIEMYNEQIERYER